MANGILQALMPMSLNFRMSDDYKPRFGRTVIRGDLWKGFHQDMGNVAKEGGIAFSNGKKPIRLIKQLMKWANNTRDGFILDFFAGSGTTAHAVMQANAEDGGNRKFIMVQLPEPCDDKSDAFKAGHKNIAGICKERIRRAGKSVLEGESHEAWSKDIGFRVLKVDSSNMKDVYYRPDSVTQGALFSLVDNIKEGRMGEDLLFQVMLDWGTDLLTSPIQSMTIAGKTVYFVDKDALAACFEAGIDENFVKALAKHKPLRAVFRDSGFGNDSTRINVEQIFKLISPNTEVKTV